jgi:Multicopper oxidase
MTKRVSNLRLDAGAASDRRGQREIGRLPDMDRLDGEYSELGTVIPRSEPSTATSTLCGRIARGGTNRHGAGSVAQPHQPCHPGMTVIAKDGWDQPAPWKCDTLNIAPGERWDVLVRATNPGTWAFHCHILPHAESEYGMFGMVTALVVRKPGLA